MSSTSDSPPVAKKKQKVHEFSEKFGDLSPIEGFRGPKTPSNRQVLRFLLYLVGIGNTLQDAAKTVVTEVLKRHTTATAKSPRRLADDVLTLHKEARFRQHEISLLLFFQIHVHFNPAIPDPRIMKIHV